MLALLMITFAAATSTELARTYLHDPLSRCFASAAAAILAPFGRVSTIGITVRYDGFEAEIGEACDGVLATCIYLAAVLAFPSRWRAKAWGALIGVAAIFLINLCRLAMLIALGAWKPDLFDRVHIYVWQALLIALSMAIWIFWVERFVRPRPEAGT
jgi:exosortase H (IPTLxxWG-CTERM-specific)